MIPAWGVRNDNITETNEYRSGVGAHWPFLSDAGRKIQKDLDIAEYSDPLHNPTIPYTIVLEPGLVIYKIYMGYWFFGRPTLEELRQDLRALLRKCRPDWDITTAELKTAYQEDFRRSLKEKFLRAVLFVWKECILRPCLPLLRVRSPRYLLYERTDRTLQHPCHKL